MKYPVKALTALPLLLLLWLLPVACVDEESELGMNLVDSTTLFNSNQATLFADNAASIRDDSTVTAYSYGFIGTSFGLIASYTGIIGNWHDATFGSVSASLYTQIALPDNTSSINLGSNIIDSVILTLATTQGLRFPDSTASYTFHFEVMQLAEPLLSDSLYYCYNTIPVNESERYFDADVTLYPEDTVVRLKLDNAIASVLNQPATAEEFVNIVKGLRIRLTDAGDEGMFYINFADNNTCLTVHHKYVDEFSDETDTAQYTFLLGNGMAHFSHFSHDYSTVAALGGDSLDGSQTLYLDPLGGYNARVSFDNDIRAFAAAHPTATVHHAELLLPVAAGSSLPRPQSLIALTGYRVGLGVPIPDYANVGVDGTYNSSESYYRLRVTRYLQDMLRNGKGTDIYLLPDERLTSAARTLLNGPSAANPLRIEIIYSE